MPTQRRRRFLATVATVGAAVLAGCGGGGDGGDDEGDENDDDGTADEDNAGEGGTGGGGGTAAATVTTSMVEASSINEIDKFSELTVEFEQITLEREGGGRTEIDVGEEVDLTEIAGTASGGGTVLVTDESIPTGTYTGTDVSVNLVNATIVKGEEPSRPIAVQYEAAVIESQQRQVTADDQLTLNIQPLVSDSIRTGDDGAEDVWQIKISPVLRIV